MIRTIDLHNVNVALLQLSNRPGRSQYAPSGQAILLIRVTPASR